jgi:hypothetical protein
MAKAAPLNHLVRRVLPVLAVLAGLAASTAPAQVVRPKAPERQTAAQGSGEVALVGVRCTLHGPRYCEDVCRDRRPALPRLDGSRVVADLSEFV